MHTTDLVRLAERGPYVVATLHGEIDVSNAGEIEEELTADLPNAVRGLVLDLTGVSFIDSTGIRLLFELATKLRRRQLELRLVVREASNLFRTLTLVQMPEVVDVFEDVDAATSDDGPR